MKNNENDRLLAHKRAVDAERRAQAILRRKAASPAAHMARVAAAPMPRPMAQEFHDVTISAALLAKVTVTI